MQIQNEDLKFLIELGKKMNAQDNRATQFPLFLVKHKVKQYVDYHWDWDEKERKEDYDGEVCEKCETNYADGMGEDYPDDCDECDPECFVYFNWVDETVEEAGVFFTAEAAQAHINQNHYHYHKPFTYATSAWRNYEMQKVLKILSSLGGNGKALSQYE